MKVRGVKPDALAQYRAETPEEHADRSPLQATSAAGRSTWKDSDLRAVPGAPVLHRASDIEMKAVTWLWKGYIPAGMITIFDGDPGLGKSTLLLNLSALITRGDPMPLETERRKPGVVLLVSFEDARQEIIKPRLVAAGADCTRVIVWDVGVSPFCMRDSLATLYELVREHSVTFIIIDPFVSAMPGDLNSNRDQDVRSVLSGVSAMAESTGAAVLLVRHLNKMTGGSALYRGGGSIGIVGAARCGLTFGRKDETDESARVLAVSKCNVGREGASLSLRVVPAPPPAPGIEVARIEWGDRVQISANDLVEGREERSEIDQAVEFLQGLLADASMSTVDVTKALLANGISDRTAKRARKRLGVEAFRNTPTGPWMMRLAVQ